MRKVLINEFWDESKIKDYLSCCYVYTEEGKYSTSNPKSNLFSNLIWEDSFEHENIETKVYFFLYDNSRIKAIVILEKFIDGKKVVFMEGYPTVHLAFKRYGTKFLLKSGYKSLKKFLSELSVQLNHSHISAIVDRACENSKKERELSEDDDDDDLVEDSFKL